MNQGNFDLYEYSDGPSTLNYLFLKKTPIKK